MRPARLEVGDEIGASHTAARVLSPVPDRVDDRPIRSSRRHFEHFATPERTPRAPLYAALAACIAATRRSRRLLLHAPVTQRIPVLLFACVHDLLLDEPDHELAQWYPNLTADHRRRPTVRLAPTFERSSPTTTTELAAAARDPDHPDQRGRSVRVPASGVRDPRRRGRPARSPRRRPSGGLNLLLDRYEYRYRPTAAVDRRRTVDGGLECVDDAATSRFRLDDA
jgi:hypothetical protein